MKLELSKEQLIDLVYKQLNNLFYLNEEEKNDIGKEISDTLKRCEVCFAANTNKYYSKDGETYFNPFHSGQYAIFLYYLSNSIFKNGKQNTLADRIYYLNKALNSCDLFYEVELPDIFILDHPVGSVMGRAQYSDYFSFSQHCTIGNNKGEFPVMQKNVQMMSGAKIIGKCNIGENVILAANTYVKDEDIPNNSIVFGSSPSLIIKKSKA